MISLLLIVNKNRYLLFRRTDNNLFALPGGHIEGNETPVDALIREIKEELGVIIPNVSFVGKYPYKNEYINVFFYNSPDFDTSKIILNDEHSEFRWFTYYEILKSKDIMTDMFKIISDYLKKT